MSYTQTLESIFPEASHERIKEVLRLCNDNIERSIEQLLIEEENSPPPPPVPVSVPEQIPRPEPIIIKAPTPIPTPTPTPPASQVESQSHSSSTVDLELDSEIAFEILKDMFQDETAELVRSFYDKFDGDVTKASDAILEHQLHLKLQREFNIEDEKFLEEQRRKRDEEDRLLHEQLKREQEKLEREHQRELEELRILHEKQKKEADLWNSVAQDIDTLTDMTGLEEHEVRPYYHQNGSSMYDALIDIVFTYTEEKKKQKEKMERTKRTELVPGRVQGGFNAVKDVPRYALTLKEKQRLEREGKKSGSSGPSSESSYTSGSASTSATSAYSDDEFEPYVFQDDSSEVLELHEIIHDSKELVNISWSFYKAALELFRGDTTMVISAAIFVYESGGAEKTYKEANRVLDFSKLSHTAKSMPETAEKEQFIPVVQKKKTITTTSTVTETKPEVDTEEGLDDYQIKIQRQGLKAAVQHSKLDLHAFNVKNAKMTASKVLERWWKDELLQREIDGRVVRTHRANMISPLIIITGRGIHSEGGIPKIRRAIKSMLDREGYLYEEDTSRFTVVGKK